MGLSMQIGYCRDAEFRVPTCFPKKKGKKTPLFEKSLVNGYVGYCIGTMRGKLLLRAYPPFEILQPSDLEV